MGESGFGAWLEDFRQGRVFTHPLKKTILESDNNLFCLLTMNHHPVHLDAEYAARHQHGRILVVGTYVFSLAVGLTVSDISGKAIANLEYDSVKHLGPVYIGDTIGCTSEVLDVRESKTRSDRGVVHVETRASNQRGECILTFRRRVLLPKRDAHAG